MQSNGLRMKREGLRMRMRRSAIQEQCIAGGAHPFTQVMSEQQGSQVDTKGDVRLDQKHGLIG